MHMGVVMDVDVVVVVVCWVCRPRLAPSAIRLALLVMIFHGIICV